MTMSRVDGVAAAAAMFDRIPDAAREQLAVELGIIGREIRQAQQAEAPKLTGQLSAGLSIAVAIEQLRVRIGLLGLKGGRAKLYYGRFVQFGRKAQTVLVQRRRRVDGKLRTARGRKRAEDIAATYSLRVKARAPHPYVRTADDPLVQELVADRLAGFWSETLAKAGAA